MNRFLKRHILSVTTHDLKILCSFKFLPAKRKGVAKYEYLKNIIRKIDLLSCPVGIYFVRAIFFRLAVLPFDCATLCVKNI